MMDSVQARGPLTNHIIHINIDGIEMRTWHIGTCRFNLALTLRDMLLFSYTAPPQSSKHTQTSHTFYHPGLQLPAELYAILFYFMSRLGKIMPRWRR